MAVDLSRLTEEERDQLFELLQAKDTAAKRNWLTSYQPTMKQNAFHVMGAEKRERLFLAGNQLGKFLRNGTPVLTPGGWRPIESLQVGEHVIAGDGTITLVTGVYPQGVQPLYEMTFDRGEKVYAGGPHLWRVLAPNARFPTRWSHNGEEGNPSYNQWTVASTEEILAKSGARPTPRRRYVTPYCGVAQMAPRPVPMDPYVLGVLLGDGCLPLNGVRISSADSEILEAVRAAGYATTYVAKYDYSVSGAMPAIRALGLAGHRSWEKFVPEIYKINSAEVRLAVLQGLMDTDGTISATHGSASFTSTSERLAKDVLELVQSFGGKGWISDRVTSYTYLGEKRRGQCSYTVRVRLPHVPLFRLARKLERVVRPVSTTDHRVIWSIDPAAPAEATCISVAHPDRTYVIEHGLVTHNTWAGAAETAMHLTGLYPSWWMGRRFNRAVTWMAGSESFELNKKGVQRLLLGPPANESQWGTTAIPYDTIKRTVRQSGVQDAIASIVVRHVSGDDSIITFASYDQGRTKWQADTLDGVWFDEEPPMDIYTEGLTRTNVAGGPSYITFTPLLGASQVVRRFIPIAGEPPAFCGMVTMTIDDVPFYSAEAKAQIIASYPEHEREARTRGIPSLGSGLVFPVAQSAIEVAPFRIPAHFGRICGIDFGWDHPFGAAWLAYDPDLDVVYVIKTFRASKQTIGQHAAVLLSQGMWQPIAWPHDGWVHDKQSGKAIKEQYKEYGLRMLAKHATFDDKDSSNYGFEAGVSMMLDRMQTGKWKVFSTCTEWFAEQRNYHRVEGKVVKVDDDVLSASRIGMMMLRHARTGSDAQYDGQGNARLGGPRLEGFGVLDSETGY